MRGCAVKKLLFVALLALLGVLGAVCWLHFHREATTEKIAYTLEPLEFGTLDETVSASGVLEPRELFVVGSEEAGKVVAVLADFNQIVSEGDPLLRLDDRMARERLHKAEAAVQLAQVSVQQAEANREVADKEWKRQRDMPKQARNQTDVDVAHGRLRVAEAAVELAKLKVEEAKDSQRQAELALRWTTIRAPILESAGKPGTGVVAEQPVSSRSKRTFVVLDRKVSLNQEIGQSMQGHLFTLASNLDRMRVRTRVMEGDIDKIRRGMKARFSLSGAEDDAPKFHGRVEDIHLVPGSDHGAVAYKVFLDVRNQRDEASGDWRLLPGQTASVDIIRRRHERTWKLPTAALNFDPPADMLSKAARAKLARAKDLKNPKHWQTVWLMDAEHRPTPIFVRTGGKNERGELGIQDGKYTEILEWDTDLRPAPDAKEPSALQFITAMPPRKKGVFSMPNIKF